MKIALLKSASLDGFITDDALFYEELKKTNEVQWCVWSEPQNWDQYDLVIVRNTWDYHQKLESFLKVLEDIDKSQARLLNPISVIKGNFHKSYLLDFQEKGIPVVPSVSFDPLNYQKYFENWQTSKMLVKPFVSASAMGIVFVEKDKEPDVLPAEGLLQPFQPEIADGETSLIFFNGRFSHAVKKKPKEGDFRIQAEYGGIFTRVDPSTELLELSQGLAPDGHLFARCDWIKLENGWALMELELIEPALYFSLAPESCKKLVAEIETFG